MSDGSETVQSFKSEAEAHLARSKLASMTIQASVHKFSRYRAMAAGGYVLKVAPRDASRARAILKKIDTEIDMDEYVDADDDSHRRCPSCRSVNLKVAPLPSSTLWFSVALLGLPLLFIKRDWTCAKCGHEWSQ